MSEPTNAAGGSGGGEDVSSSIASQIIDRADRDIAFAVQLTGESQYLLIRHFEKFVEGELKRRGVVYGDHPLLRPFIETHARELADFVLSGVGLRYRFSLQAFEKLAGDPARLLRADLWDLFRTYVEDAQRHFLTGVGGLQRNLAQIENPRARPPSS